MAGDISYLSASYRGIPFRVKDATDTFGRRGESYEYPNRDEPGYLDLGRRARKHKVTGYVTAEDHLSVATALSQAAEQKGPGALIHPWLGGISVVCISLEISHEFIDKKRHSKFSFDFLEPGEDNGATGNGFIDQLSVFLPSLIDVLVTSSDSIFSSSGNLLPQVVDEIQFTSRSLTRSLSGIDDTRFFPTFGRLERVSSLETVARAEPYARLFQDVLATVSSAGPRILGYRATYVRLIQVSDDLRKPVPGSAGLEKPINSLYGSTRVGLVGQAALLTRGIEYATLFEALQDLDKMVGVLDTEARIAVRLGDSFLYSQIAKLRAQVISDMIRTNIGKPGVVLRNRAGQLPSLVLAYETYEDAKRAAELERYNPSFSPWALGQDYWGASR